MDIVVSALGWLEWRGRRVSCVLGRSGVSRDKSEGDGATPIGCWDLRRVLFRADRRPPPRTGLPVAAITPDDGWCDDPGHPDYNKPVRLPHPASCESLWRDDRLYDLVVVLGHNDSPPRPGLGSAIFLHIAHPDRRPTQGCVAVAPDILEDILTDCHPGDRLRVQAGGDAAP